MLLSKRLRLRLMTLTGRYLEVNQNKLTRDHLLLQQLSNKVKRQALQRTFKQDKEPPAPLVATDGVRRVLHPATVGPLLLRQDVTWQLFGSDWKVTRLS